MSNYIGVVFEVPEEYTEDKLHEDLCLAIHEHDLKALNTLMVAIRNIALTNQILKRDRERN
jgi:uncharacterized protein YneR